MVYRRNKMRQGQQSLRLSYRGVIVALLLVFMNINKIWATPLTLSDEEEVKQRTRQEAQDREQRQQQSDIFLQKKKIEGEDTSLPAEDISFQISSVRLEGERLESFPWAQEMLEKYNGRSIGSEGINVIVKRLTNAFIERGYVTTRVFVPEQDLSTGTLHLILVPGVIRDIRIEPAKHSGSWHTAFPTRPGNILNLRDLEQGLEQMKRIPSQDVNMQLQPGDKPGESDIVISVKESKRWKVVTSMDDSGSKSTGEKQASITFSLDNLLGINDLFNVAMNKDAEADGEKHGTRGDSIYYSFPYGYWTFTISKNHYKYHQTVQGYYTSYISSGKSEGLDVKVQRLLQRSQTSKTSVGARISKKKSKSFLDDTELEVQRKDTTAAELSVSHRQYFGQAVLDIELANRRGVPWFGAQAEVKDLPPDTPTTRYNIWTLDTSITTPMKIGKTNARYSLNLRAQTTPSNVTGSEYFSIGNRYTVRGFDGEQTLSAEKGWYIRNELSFSMPKGHEIYLGLDHGKVSGNATKWLAGTKLTGAVIGLRGGVNDLRYEVFLGRPLQKPENFRTAHTTMGFNVTYQI